MGDSIGESLIVGHGSGRHDGAMTSIELEHRDPEPSPARLERPLAGRWVAGVAAALAARWGVPRWLLRIGFLVLLPVGGLGALLYLLGWLFIPRQGDPEAPIGLWVDHLGEWQAWAGAALVGIGIVFVLSYLDFIATTLIWAAALVVFGVLLYRGDIGPSSQPVDGRRAEQRSDDHSYEVELEQPVPPVDQPSEPQRERSYLGRLTLGALLVTLGIMAAVDLADITSPTTRHYFGAAILVVGIGLVVGTIYGRSRGLILFGALLAPFVLVASLADIRFDGEFGDIDRVITSPNQLESRYRLSGGRLYLDLRRLTLEGETVTVDAGVGAGQIEILVPPDYEIRVDGRVGLGELSLLGESTAGLDRERTATRAGSGGTLVLALNAGVGQVAVRDFGHFFVGLPLERDAVIIQPTSIEQLDASYSIGEGLLQFDFRDLTPGDPLFQEAASLDALVGTGEIVVILPPWLDVSVGAEVGRGAIEIMGGAIAGTDLSESMYIEGDGTQLIELSLIVDQGAITVVRP